MVFFKIHHIALQNTSSFEKCLKYYEKEVTEYKYKFKFSGTFPHCPFIIVSLVLFLENTFTQKHFRNYTHARTLEKFSKIAFQQI